MSEMVITLVRVYCEEVTDDFLEGTTDEFGWRITRFEENGSKVVTEEIPMHGMEAVEAGAEYQLDRELGGIGPSCREAWLEFWDKDTFSEDDLLGRIEIRRDEAGELDVTPTVTATEREDGSYHFTGHHGDYTVWLTFAER